MPLNIADKLREKAEDVKEKTAKGSKKAAQRGKITAKRTAKRGAERSKETAKRGAKRTGRAVVEGGKKAPKKTAAAATSIGVTAAEGIAQANQNAREQRARDGETTPPASPGFGTPSAGRPEFELPEPNALGAEGSIGVDDGGGMFPGDAAAAEMADAPQTENDGLQVPDTPPGGGPPAQAAPSGGFDMAAVNVEDTVDPADDVTGLFGGAPPESPGFDSTADAPDPFDVDAAAAWGGFGFGAETDESAPDSDDDGFFQHGL